MAVRSKVRVTELFKVVKNQFSVLFSVIIAPMTLKIHTVMLLNVMYSKKISMAIRSKVMVTELFKVVKNQIFCIVLSGHNTYKAENWPTDVTYINVYKIYFSWSFGQRPRSHSYLKCKKLSFSIVQ